MDLFTMDNAGNVLLITDAPDCDWTGKETAPEFIVKPFAPDIRPDTLVDTHCKAPDNTADVPEIEPLKTDPFNTSKLSTVKEALADPAPEITRDDTVVGPAFKDPTIVAFPETARDAQSSNPLLTIPAKF